MSTARPRRFPMPQVAPMASAFPLRSDRPWIPEPFARQPPNTERSTDMTTIRPPRSYHLSETPAERKARKTAEAAPPVDPRTAALEARAAAQAEREAEYEAARQRFICGDVGHDVDLSAGPIAALWVA